MEDIKEKLSSKHKNGYMTADEKTVADAMTFCDSYKEFLDAAKTEREAVKVTEALAKEKGFVEFKEDMSLKAGDKIYLNNRNKAIILAVIGENGCRNGVNIAAAHIDSPRLDLRPIPLYEASGLALFKTHYYGGIKKYQWVATPLALHGKIIRSDGKEIEVSIGEDALDTRFCITDLLPHLSQEQSEKTIGKAIEGENLNILVGSRPLGNEASSFKLNILKILNDAYGITEDDLISAELEFVPAGKACDIGFDRSMIGAYGHDDRVCAYPVLRALFECEVPSKTAVAVLCDKEEIGSEGNTGLNSRFLENFIEELAICEGQKGHRVLSKSKCLSADVTSAFDPNYPTVFEPQNSCYVNHGVGISKYAGARGKSSASDASAEYLSEIRRLLDEKNIVWQIGELGRVDLGGSGTVAKYIANLGVDVIDIGVPVLSMHAPFEVVSKLDVFMAFRAFSEFFFMA